MGFRELVSPTLKDLFVKEIEGMILSGELKTGERLPNERELAEKMNVSRAVINGGITELAAKGFLEVTPRKGTRVADYKRKGKLETLEAILEYNGGRFDPEMLDSIFEVRGQSERYVSSLAAARRSAEDVAQLREKLALIERLENPRELAEETFEFYRLINIASGNIVYPLMHHAFQPIYVPLMEAMFKRGYKEKRMGMMVRLVDLIEVQKQEEAAECAGEIIQWGREALAQHYTAGQRI